VGEGERDRKKESQPEDIAAKQNETCISMKAMLHLIVAYAAISNATYTKTAFVPECQHTIGAVEICTT
jgi:hypothetical protein